MSKLLDKLQRAYQESPRRIGFGTAAQERRPSLPLLVGVVDVAQGLPGDDVTSHVDGLVFRMKSAQDALPDVGEAVPWGAWVESAGAELLETLQRKQADFLIFAPQETPVTVLRDPDIGKLLQVPAIWDGEPALSLVDTPVDAIVASPSQTADLTVQQLIDLTAVRGLFRKPLLVLLRHQVASEELEVLRDSGVDCVMLDASDAQEVARVRGVIEELPPPRRSSEGTGSVSLVPGSSSRRTEEDA